MVKVNMNTKSTNLGMTEFFNSMLSAGLTKGYLFSSVNGLIKSTNDPEAEMLFDLIIKNYNYKLHEAIFFQLDSDNQCLFMVFVHSTVRGQAQGGTRFSKYNNLEDLISDGLRLSKAMTDKNALSQLWWGGGKSVICPIDELAALNNRESIFQNFGSFIAGLNGIYIAAEDVNTTPEDMRVILSRNRFVTCLPPSVGGSANPSIWTARGVFNGFRATMQFYLGTDNLSDVSVSIQGLGNVGKNIAQLVLEAGGRINVFDTNKNAYDAIASLKGEVVIASSLDELLAMDATIFCPCAFGGVINPQTIMCLRSKYIIGAANNQLLNPEQDSTTLHNKGIIYIPDFFINRMGIINCANEQYGWLAENLDHQLKDLFDDTLSLLATAEELGVSPYTVALIIANERARVPHPIWGHRGKKLIENYIFQRINKL